MYKRAKIISKNKKTTHLTVIRCSLLAILLAIFNFACSVQNETGLKKIYYPSGKLQLESYYKNGQLDGISKLYRETGELWIERNYVNGEKEGISKVYNEDGTWKEEYYKSNKEDGHWLTYSKDGKKISFVDYKNGQLKKVATLEQDEKLKLVWDYDDGKLVRISWFYPASSVLEVECDYKDNKLNGLCKKYYENGGIHYIDTFGNGEKVRRSAYDKEGKLDFEQDY